MRPQVQPGLRAGADPRHFVSSHWGWLRGLLVLCLLFAVGATETEAIRFQSRQAPRPLRVRKFRHTQAGRRDVRQVSPDFHAGEMMELAIAGAPWLPEWTANPAQAAPSLALAGPSVSSVASPLTVLAAIEALPVAAAETTPGSGSSAGRAPPSALL